MESFKEKIPMFVAGIVAVLLIVGAYYILFVQKTIYYVQIDNTKIEQVSNSDDMKYQYTLTAYNKNGKLKEVQFKTSRELRENAYLELEMMAVRGVYGWKEVQPEDLPDKVKAEMNVE